MPCPWLVEATVGQRSVELVPLDRTILAAVCQLWPHDLSSWVPILANRKAHPTWRALGLE